VVARDRSAGARLIETTPATVIVMDDGLQNPTLAKDLRIALVDSRRGVGNGRVIPAGPLRAPLAHQLAAIDLIGWVGDSGPDSGSPVTEVLGVHAPIIRLTRTVVSDSSHVAGRRCLAFCGIADPARFFTTVESTGAMLIGRRAFPDHHMFSESDARGLLDEARRLDAELVTTEKDSVRLPEDGATFGELKARSSTIAISMASDRDGESLLVDRLRAILT
jgi:tetraacyldisaccharide 4'-kinase